MKSMIPVFLECAVEISRSNEIVNEICILSPFGVVIAFFPLILNSFYVFLALLEFLKAFNGFML